MDRISLAFALIGWTLLLLLGWGALVMLELDRELVQDIFIVLALLLAVVAVLRGGSGLRSES